HEAVDDLLRAVLRGNAAPDLQSLEIFGRILGSAPGEGGGARSTDSAGELPAAQDGASSVGARTRGLPWGRGGVGGHARSSDATSRMGHVQVHKVCGLRATSQGLLQKMCVTWGAVRLSLPAPDPLASIRCNVDELWAEGARLLRGRHRSPLW